MEYDLKTIKIADLKWLISEIRSRNVDHPSAKVAVFQVKRSKHILMNGK